MRGCDFFWLPLCAVAWLPLAVLANETVTIVGRLADGTTTEDSQNAALPTFDIQKTEVRHLPDRTITIHHVADPGLTEPAAGGDDARETDAAAEESGPESVLALSASVYDHQVTLLRWHHDGQPYSAWSNVDFNYLTGFTKFRKGDKVFVNLLMVQNLEAASLPAGTADTIPQEMDDASPTFVVIDGDIENAEALRVSRRCTSST